MQMQFKNIGKEVKAEIYKDRFCIRIGAKKYYLVFSLEVCFKFSLNLKSI
jgi:hypothetical protein